MTIPSVSPAVAAVCRAHNADIDLIHARIYGFLDVSPQWTLAAAAAAGHLRLVQRLSCRTSQDHDDAIDAMDQAATHGHLHVLQWLHTHRHEGCSDLALVGASHAGHTAVVQWLLEHRHEGRVGDAIAGAATQGHEELVAWLLRHTHLRATATPLAPSGVVGKALPSTRHWVAQVELALVL